MDRWESGRASHTVIALSGLHRTRLTAAPAGECRPDPRRCTPASESCVRATSRWRPTPFIVPRAHDPVVVLATLTTMRRRGAEALARRGNRAPRGPPAPESRRGRAVTVFVIHGALTRLLAYGCPPTHRPGTSSQAHVQHGYIDLRVG